MGPQGSAGRGCPEAKAGAAGVLVLTPGPGPVVAWSTERMSQAGTRLTLQRPGKGSGSWGSFSGAGGGGGGGNGTTLLSTVSWEPPPQGGHHGYSWAWGLLGSPVFLRGTWPGLGLGCEDRAVGLCVSLCLL